MFARQVVCVVAVSVCGASLLQGCSSDHAAFGAKDMKRVEDVRGRPTYSMEGKTYYGMDPEREANKVMLAACPNGNPEMLQGNAFSVKGQDRYGAPVSGVFWYATFSCDQEVPGV